MASAKHGPSDGQLSLVLPGMPPRDSRADTPSARSAPREPRARPRGRVARRGVWESDVAKRRAGDRDDD